MIYAFSVFISFIVCIVAMTFINYFVYKRRPLIEKAAREWMSFGGGMLFLNLIPFLTDGDMVNRKGEVVDPLWYLYFSVSLFVICFWGAALHQRKERLKNKKRSKK